MMKSLATKAMLAAGAATVAISAVSAPAEAFQVFTNRAAWEAAITGANPIVTEGFEGLPTGDLPLPYTTPTTGITFNSVDLDINFNGGNPGAKLSSSIDSTPGLVISFSDSIAAGFDIQDQIVEAFAGTVQYTLSSGKTGDLGALFGPYKFFGFVQESGDPLLSSIKLTYSGGLGVSAVNLDNVSYATPASTPIPTPALLPGLIGMGVAALRKRKGEADEAEA